MKQWAEAYARKLRPKLVIERFWIFPTPEKELTPNPRIYADLLNIGDARCLEAADLI